MSKIRSRTAVILLLTAGAIATADAGTREVRGVHKKHRRAAEPPEFTVVLQGVNCPRIATDAEAYEYLVVLSGNIMSETEFVVRFDRQEEMDRAQRLIDQNASTLYLKRGCADQAAQLVGIPTRLSKSVKRAGGLPNAFVEERVQRGSQHDLSDVWTLRMTTSTARVDYAICLTDLPDCAAPPDVLWPKEPDLFTTDDDLPTRESH